MKKFIIRMIQYIIFISLKCVLNLKKKSAFYSELCVGFKFTLCLFIFSGLSEYNL